MRTQITSLILFGVLAGSLLLSAEQPTVPGWSEVRVRVVEDATGKPVVGARVEHLCTVSPYFGKPFETDSNGVALTAVALAINGVQHIWAGYYPIPDPRHGGHLPFTVAMTLLPVLLTAAMWKQVGTGLKVYLVGSLVLLAAVLTLRSGLSGLDRYEYRGLLQRVFTLAIFPPIGVAAYALASRIRQGSRRSGL